MNDGPVPHPRPTRRVILTVAAWGATTVVVAYLLSRGNLVAFVLIVVAIGIAQRVLAVRAFRRRGHDAPKWWTI